MEARAPSPTRVMIAAGFALSCIALGIGLWVTFGGAIPLKPVGYRVEIPVDEASQLTAQSDVRISGVSVGTVKGIEVDSSGQAVATVEMDSEYAPISAETRAMVRQKTLLGEMYLELTPGSDDDPALADGGRLAAAQVRESVQLDEVLRAFDPRTRAALQTWMQGGAQALSGRGQDLSIALGSLEGFAAEAHQVSALLDEQGPAVRGLVRDGSEVVAAASERRGQLAGLVRGANTVFEATARRDRSLRQALVVLPTFLRETRATLTRLDGFAARANPVVSELRPAVRELTPTLRSTARLAPELRRLVSGLRPTVRRGPRGLVALRELLDSDLPPLLDRLQPFLGELTPVLEMLDDYRRETSAFFANVASATNAVSNEGAGLINYLRGTPVLAPESFAGYPRRLVSNRTNPYVAAGGYELLRTGLQGFETRQCSGGIDAILDPATPDDPAFRGRFPFSEDPAADAERLFEGIEEFGFVGKGRASGVPRPGCVRQAPASSIGGGPEELTEYPHVFGLGE